MNKGTFIAMVLGVCVFGTVANATAQTTDSTQQILQLQKFPDGLVLTGNRQPTEVENAALLSVLNQMDAPTWTTNLEKFLTANPQSPWTPSLCHNYAQSCRQSGRTTKALEQWEAAWPLVKDDTSPGGHTLAGTILANWMEQLASLGRYQKLQELSAAGDAMNFSNPADRDKFQSAKNSWLMMLAHPNVAFRCGTFALKAVGGILRPGDRDLQQLVGIPSPTNGFSMAQLVELAKKYQLDLIAVKRVDTNAPIIIPSVVHWRQNHYAAILERQENVYRVDDPTFGREKWLTAEGINDEAGGEFLIPSSAVTNGWQPLNTGETELVHGMGLSFHIKDANDKGCKPGQPCPPCGGMPVWWVSEPYINLWMADEPMSYRLSSGEDFTFRLTYKQRDARPAIAPFNGPVFWTGVGSFYVPGWTHSWVSMIRLENKLACSGGACSAGSLSAAYATVYLPGGGTVSFAPGQNYDPETGIQLLYTHPTAGALSTANGYGGLRLLYPDGSQDIYGWVEKATYQSGQVAHADYYRTRHIDRRGRSTWYNYGAVVPNSPGPGVNVLLSVTDPDGRTNTLQYISSGNNVLLSEVDSPDGLAVRLGYDANGSLANIADAQNLSSYINYATNGYPATLITPYGTNTFAIIENANWQTTNANLTGHGIDRAVQVTDPVGATSLWIYRDDSSTFMSANISASEIPAGTPLGTLDGGGAAFPAGYCFLNSFYWGPRQFGSLSTNNLAGFTSSDYLRGRMRHWLVDSNLLNVTGYLSVERDPSPDGSAEGLKTFYDYQGKYPNFNYSEGTNALPAVTAWRIPGGESHWQWSRRDGYGNVTNVVSTATLPDGTLGTRTNQFIYQTNIYVMTGNIPYSPVNSFTVANLLTAIIAEDGQTVWSAGSFDTVSATVYHRVNSSSSNTTTLTWSRVVPSRVTNALNQTAALTFSGFDQVTSFKSFSGLTTTNLYNSATNGFLIQSIDLEIGRTNSFGYTVNGMIGAFTNELGLNLSLTWDNLLRPTGTQFPDGTTEITGYNRLDANYHQDRQGVQAIYSFDNARHPQNYFVLDSGYGILDARYWSWCGCGALTSIADAYTNTTTLNYDNAGRFTGYNFPDNSTLTRQLDVAGRVTNVMDGAGRYLRPAYNHQGLVTNVMDALGHNLQRVQFDLRDRPAIVTDASGVTVTNVFDNASRLIQRRWPDNVAEGWGYNERGLFAYTNRNGKITYWGRDVAGRAIAETNANQEVVSAIYNPADQITALTDGLQHTRLWQRNAYGWVTNKLDGLNRTAFRQQFNPDGWVTNRWTPEKGDLNITRDGLGRTRSVGYNGTLAKTYGYDLARRMTNFTDALGSHNLAWTPASRLQSESDGWTTNAYAYSQGLRTNFSIGNWTQSYNYDLGWRMTNTTSQAGAFLYEYAAKLTSTAPAADGLVSLIRLPNGAYITNNFDSLARLKSTALQDHWHHVLDGYTYTADALGLRTNILRDFGLTTNSVNVGYDNINQILSWNAQELDGTPRLNEQLGFAYDKADNLQTRISGNLTQTFTADAADQLASVTRSGTLTLSGVTPAPALNLTVNGQAAARYADMTFAATNLTLANGANTFTVIATNLYGVKKTNTVSANLPANVGFAFDNNGNLTNDGVKAFFYDAENQLTNVTQTGVRKTDFVYDGLNRRRIVRDYIWTNSAWFKISENRIIFDGLVPVQERDASNNVLVTYTRGIDFSGGLNRAGGIGGLLARTDSNGTLYYHADGSGNETALMDGKEQIAGRYLYEPFGRLIRMTGSAAQANTMRFSSMPDYWFGGAGFYGRIWLYMPQRWANEDPIQELGGRNLARGMHNNPLSYIDPFGFQVTAPAGPSVSIGTGGTFTGTSGAVGEGTSLTIDAGAAAGEGLALGDAALAVAAPVGAAGMGAMVFAPFLGALDNDAERFPGGVNGPPMTATSPLPQGVGMLKDGEYVDKDGNVRDGNDNDRIVRDKFGNEVKPCKDKQPPKRSPKAKPPTNPPQMPPKVLPPGHSVREMPGESPAYPDYYPNGYWIQYDESGNPINPATGKNASSREDYHVPYPSP